MTRTLSALFASLLLALVSQPALAAMSVGVTNLQTENLDVTPGSIVTTATTSTGTVGSTTYTYDTFNGHGDFTKPATSLASTIQKDGNLFFDFTQLAGTTVYAELYSTGTTSGSTTAPVFSYSLDGSPYTVISNVVSNFNAGHYTSSAFFNFIVPSSGHTSFSLLAVANAALSPTFYSFTFKTSGYNALTPVPEPSETALMIAGLLMLGFTIRSRHFK